MPSTHAKKKAAPVHEQVVAPDVSWNTGLLDIIAKDTAATERAEREGSRIGYLVNKNNNNKKKIKMNRNPS